MIRLNRKGQNTLEYVLLITAVVVAFLIIQHYLGRGLQGRVREASDNIGGQFDAEATSTDYTTTRFSDVHETTEIGLEGGAITTSLLEGRGESSARTGSETVSAP